MTQKKGTKAKKLLLEIPTNQILAKDNIRTGEEWRKVEDLLKLIRAQGQINPVKVTPLEKAGPHGERYLLRVGFRRFEVCKKLKRKVWAVVDTSKLSPKQLLLLQFSENNGRENLSPIDEARLFQLLISEHGMRANQIAKDAGVTEGYVSQRLKMLGLPDDVQKKVQSGQLSPTQARELGRLSSPAQQQKLADEVEKKGLTAGDLRKKVEKKVRKGRPSAEDAPEDAGTFSIVRSPKEVVDQLMLVNRRMADIREKKDMKDQREKLALVQGMAIWQRWLTEREYKLPV